MITLVIADDEQIIRQGLMTIRWGDLGIRVEGVGANGIETLNLVRKTKPHLLLTDIRMPGIGGIELAEIISEELSETKIIFLTAYHDFDYAYAAIKMNVLDFILKPAEPAELIASVEKAKEIVERNIAGQEHIASMNRQLKQYRQLAKEEIAVNDAHDLPIKVIQDVLDHLKTNYNQDLTIASTAERVHLSPGYLSRLLKKETGDTFLEILTRIRMEEAALLLKNKEIMIYEIAERVGFRDARYFSEVFREHYGMNPTAFKTNILRRQ